MTYPKFLTLSNSFELSTFFSLLHVYICPPDDIIISPNDYIWTLYKDVAYVHRNNDQWPVPCTDLDDKKMSVTKWKARKSPWGKWLEKQWGSNNLPTDELSYERNIRNKTNHIVHKDNSSARWLAPVPPGELELLVSLGPDILVHNVFFQILPVILVTQQYNLYLGLPGQTVHLLLVILHTLQ